MCELTTLPAFSGSELVGQRHRSPASTGTGGSFAGMRPLFFMAVNSLTRIFGSLECRGWLDPSEITHPRPSPRN
jgi:hypothetical protein